MPNQEPTVLYLSPSGWQRLMKAIIVASVVRPDAVEGLDFLMDADAQPPLILVVSGTNERGQLLKDIREYVDSALMALEIESSGGTSG